MGTFIGDLWNDFTDIPPNVFDILKTVAIPGVAVGIMVFQNALLIGSPHVVIQGLAYVAPGLVGNLLPRTRRMSPEERTLARLVYGNSLPSFGDIYLTNVVGWGDRFFTIINRFGEILVNIGEAFEDPIRYTTSTYPEFGQVLIHELGHVWQIHHVGPIEYIREADPQGDYDPGDGSKPWNDYGEEQQATIVDIWYSGVNVYSGPNLAAPCSRGNLFFNHVRDTVNAGNEPPAVQPLSVRDIAKLKFDENGGFLVSSTFPRHNSGSLRRRLIGLKN